MEASAPAIERPAPRPSRLAALWKNAIGKKWLMAVTGIVLFAYVLVHMLANLQVYSGSAETLNAYGRFLRIAPALLWAARIVLLAALAVHVVAGVQLYLGKKRARPQDYAQWTPAVSSPASRTMIWSGFLIFAFVVYHLLDLTIGTANPDFRHGDIYHNIIVSLAQLGASIAYLVAMLALGFHLWHGLWSMFQSLGVANRAWLRPLKKFAVIAATLIALGFASIPIAVLTGVIR
ncbi:MAG TPA: succinate dehydrogenase cytochrome b subunit [Anaeromyxobacteraceae bacterium]|nr:succinate dehydrogenase cytochrome b subunit [Anaeromyxobacteraceae bacterium]